MFLRYLLNERKNEGLAISVKLAMMLFRWTCFGESMRLCMILLLAVFVGPSLVAEDKVDLAVGFPATTLAYASASESWVEYSNEFSGAFEGFGQEFEMPSLGKIFRERLALEMTDEDADALASGIKRGAVGLLDIEVSGPKLQLVLEHKDLSALIAALNKCHKDNPDLVPEIEDYYGTDVYKLNVLFAANESSPDFNMFSFILGQLTNGVTIDEDFYLAALNNEYLIISTSKSAVKDGIDFLSYPEDAEDTLLGNRRYKEAIAEFGESDALLFVNVSSVISTIERVAGDKGSNPMLGALFGRNSGNDKVAEFLFSLLQYEQFKSYAASMDYNPDENTFIVNASLDFHNAPGWFEAIRVEPEDWNLLEFIPPNALQYSGSTVGELGDVYSKFREYFFARAKNADQAELTEGWESFEDMFFGSPEELNGFLSMFGAGAGYLMLDTSFSKSIFSIPDMVGIVGLKDVDGAEDYFYDKIMSTKLGKLIEDSGMENETASIDVYKGVEIHYEQNNVGYAFMSSGKKGVFLIGTLNGIHQVIDAKQTGKNLSNSAVFQEAKELTWPKVSAFQVQNIGSTIDYFGNVAKMTRSFGWNRRGRAARDDVEKGNDLLPFIADVFRSTTALGVTRSAENGVEIRVAVAGIPNKKNLKAMLTHFKKVALNNLIRDDLLMVRRGLRDSYSVTGKMDTLESMVEAGRIEKKESIDNYDLEDKRTYAIAKQAVDPDIRQAILLAHQKQPGLRGKFVAVLWNGDILTLTEEQLADAITRAESGQRVDDAEWYAEALEPLIDTFQEEPEEYEGWEEVKAPAAKVVIIDEDGDEDEKEVDLENATEETEEILDDIDALEAAEKEKNKEEE